MDGPTLGALITGIAGLLAAIGTAIKAWLDGRAGVKNSEVDVSNLALAQVSAAMTHMASVVDELQQQVEDLKVQLADVRKEMVTKDATITELTASLARAEAYVAMLIAHIEAGYGPPAPVFSR